MIPKIIHYCWFGRGELPRSVRKCIDSWKKICPDYSIFCWNEDNFDINTYRYTKEAYNAKKYAFVSDVARLIALKEMGGFYLDTDIELLRSLDFLLKYKALGGFEEGNYLQTAFLASEPNGEWVAFLLDSYQKRHYILEDGMQDITTNVSVITDMTVNAYSLVRNNTEQDLGVVHVFPAEYFSPKSFRTGLINKTKNTVCIHHFDSTWTGKAAHSERMHRYKVYSIFGNELGRKVLSFEEISHNGGIGKAVRRIFRKRLFDKEARKILLYGHTGSNNHGCEALVRTIPMALKDYNISLISTRPETDRSYGVPIEKIIQWKNSMSEFSPKWFAYKICEKILHSKTLCDRIDKNRVLLREMTNGYNAVFAIGGDNYCYDQGKSYYSIDNDLHKTGVKNGIIGCSFEPGDLEGELGRHIASFGLITARESITYNAVKKAGHPNVYLIPDTAFILPRIDLPLQEKWQPGDTIGLNFSPLCLKYAGDQDEAKKAVREFIQYLLDNTTSTLAFISHVYKENGGDGELMKELTNGLNQDRMVFIHDEKLNCMEIKGYIARCKLFIGARTHATIAAYSSCVPTLAIGYSVKSRGIARDLFGSEDNYVLPIEKMSDSRQLVDSYNYILLNSENIRRRLAEMMPLFRSEVLSLNSMIEAFLSE